MLAETAKHLMIHSLHRYLLSKLIQSKLIEKQLIKQSEYELCSTD
jgi:hypothetical protein